MHLKVISAGAGSGKTFTLTKEMAGLLMPGPNGEPAAVRASGLLATTFTSLAAAELEERVRVRLLEAGLTREADELSNAMIGTVHGVGAKLLKRFAFEAGVSPEVEIVATEDQQRFFNRSLSSVLDPEIIDEMDALSLRLGFQKTTPSSDWREAVRNITEVARSNNFDAPALRRSLAYSLDSFFALLPQAEKHGPEYYRSRLEALLQETLEALNANETDTTAKKIAAAAAVKAAGQKLKNDGELPWYEWAKLMKLDVSKKSESLAADLIAFAAGHDRQPAFHEDIRRFVTHLFEVSVAALQAYETYKKSRGLIDYTDMEVLVLRLLDNPDVQAVLREELDLLLVDEFQDTNPIQLQIFLQLTRLTKLAIWVGDPKQSIYGFRGAAPELMEAVIGAANETQVLPYSWRSRETLVHSINGLFTKAFDDMPSERVALQAAPPNRHENEPQGLETAFWHWHFRPDEGGKSPGGQWFNLVLAREIAGLFQQNYRVRARNGTDSLPLRPCDVAVLCRTNDECKKMADALAAHGVRASVARAGLLKTPEACLTLACLRFILNVHDSLAIAEILRLADGQALEDIVDHRMAFLEKKQAGEVARWTIWAHENPFVEALEKLRRETKELSPAELLTLAIEQLDLRRMVSVWGNAPQRHANLDELRRLALQYEDACHRRHDAATWGGFLLWLDALGFEGLDMLGEEAGDDTVQVLTFHRSKGLEWPLVICHGLETALKESVFGLSIVRENPEIDLENPLAHRLVRYWPNPYADQKKGTNLFETIEQHEARREGIEKALKEETRILYVALTRARDYLVIPSRIGAHTKMLNRVWHGGREDVPTLDPESRECPWLWNGLEVPVLPRIVTSPRDYEPPRLAPPDTPLPYLRPRAGSREHVPLVVDAPDARSTALRLRTGKILLYGGQTAPEDLPLLDALLGADDPAYALERRLKLGEQLLAHFGVPDWDTEGLIAFSDAFYQNFQSLYGPPNRLLRKFPVRANLGGRLFETTIDLIFETDAGSVLVFHQNNAVEQFRWKNKALEESARIGVAMETLSAMKPLAAWVHYWQGGGLVELVR